MALRHMGKMPMLLDAASQTPSEIFKSPSYGFTARS